MKKIILAAWTIALISLSACTEQSTETTATIETTLGSIVIKLYNDTPLHKANFEQMVEARTYDSMLFHRVIQDFMIQTGDPTSKDAAPGALLGEASAGEDIDNEISPCHIHRRGVLAAAREGNNVNPTRRSSGSHFYLAKGKIFTLEELEEWVEETNEKRRTQAQGIDNPDFKYTPLTLTEEQKETYTTIGGIPHLDGEYTIFGEIIEGYETLEKIISVDTDQNDRPLENIIIKEIRLN